MWLAFKYSYIWRSNALQANSRITLRFNISESETKSFAPQDKLLTVYGIKLGTLCVKIKKFGRIGNEKMRLEFMYSYNIKTNL